MGQRDEHQPLFQSYTKPIETPITTAIINIIAVAKPLLFKKACLSGTIKYKDKTEIKNRIDCNSTDIFFFFERLKCLGKRLVVAKGHTFRHTPTDTTSNNGAMGIRMSQSKVKPIFG